MSKQGFDHQNHEPNAKSSFLPWNVGPKKTVFIFNV